MKLTFFICLFLCACGSKDQGTASQSIPICAAPMTPTFVGKTQWLYYNGVTFTSYVGGCENGR